MAEKQKKVVKRPNRVMRFYRETTGELHKVSWPTRKEAWHLTRIVLAVLVIMAIYLGGLDAIGAWLIGFALGA
ncbi:MAG: preprotein translocase subunit SecE [Anaerolineales bacterium]|nr:preprotein translocase subunit SecE [Anaerolineales bacterium]